LEAARWMKIIMVERNEEIGVSWAADERYFEIVLMDLTEGREQVDAGNLGVNSRDWGAEKKRYLVCIFTEDTNLQSN